MNLPASLFSSNWHGLAGLICVLVLVWVVRHAPWKRLTDNSQRNLIFGFAVALALLWSMKAGVQPGLSLHLIGAMAACLTMGPALALVSLALALTGITLNGATEWAAWPINFVLMAVVPVSCARLLQRLVEQYLPAHFFVFIFIVAFAGAALTAVFQGVVASGVLVAAGAYSLEFLLSDYLPYFILLGFSEAWISGAVVTLLVVYKPEWVIAFDDKRYLIGK